MTSGGNRSGGKHPDVLVAVEDPGAANFVLELPGALRAGGMSCRVLAFGHAPEFLRDRGVAYVEPEPGAEPAQVLAAHLPGLLLAGTSQNPDSPVLALLDAARERGLCTVGFVDMAVDAHLRFNGRTGDPLAHAPEWLLVADAATERAFADLGFPAGRMKMCGHPSHDRVRRRARELAGRDRAALRREVLGADPAPRPVWAFVAEHGDGDPRLQRGPGYTLHGRGDSDRRVDIVLEEILDAAAACDPRPFVVLRLHPKNTRKEFARYLPEVDVVSAGGDPLDLVWVADLVVGLSSMLLMEAALMDRPTLSVNPREEERAWSPGVQAGRTPCAWTRQALRALLADPPVPLPDVAGPDAISCVAACLAVLLADSGASRGEGM